MSILRNQQDPRLAALRREYSQPPLASIPDQLAARAVMVNTIVPFWVTIIIVVIVIIGIAFTSLFWWHSTRRPRAKEAEAREVPGLRPRPGRSERYQIPTMVFQHHEPETHGYFAPVYLVSADDVDVEQAAAAKAVVRSYMTTGLEAGTTKTMEKTGSQPPPRPPPPPPAPVNSELPGRI